VCVDFELGERVSVFDRSPLPLFNIGTDFRVDLSKIVSLQLIVLAPFV